MRKLFALLAAAALAGGAWLLTNKVEIEGLDQLRFAPKASVASQTLPAASHPTIGGGVVRIASFQLRVFDESKTARPHVLKSLAELIRRFDVVAIQGLRSPSEEPLQRLIEAVNAGGRQFEYVVSPLVGRGGIREQFAFVFDAARLEIDRSELYVVNDPYDLMRHEPWVAWFRVRGPRPDQAFTFTLVNVSVDPQRVEQELNVLAEVFLKVRYDGRGEDDVILLGDFQTDDQNLGRLTELPRIAWAISGTTTTTVGQAPCDNLIFDSRATNEFTGRVGVCDFLREFNLSPDEARAISEHLPVWAEFGAYEGAR